MTYEGTQSTTPCPPSYSPASQRSRYSQPNLPTLLVSYDRKYGTSSSDRRIRMSQPTLNSSFTGINLAGINRGSPRLSYTSLRAASGDNSINEEERLSTPNVHALDSGTSGTIVVRQSATGSTTSRLSQPDVRRYYFPRHDISSRRDRLSQPTLVTGDYYPGRGHQQRLSQPCLSTRKESLPTMLLHSPSPPPQLPPKHKRFGAIATATQRDRLSQLDIGSKYRNLKEFSYSAVKFNRDRFSIPELETQNDLRLIAGTPKQRFSLDSQLTRNQDSTRSRLLPIASSPISEHQQGKEEGIGTTTTVTNKLKSPTCEGLEKVLVASTSPIFPPGERHLLKPDFSAFQSAKTKGTSVATTSSTGTIGTVKTMTSSSSKAPNIPVVVSTRERLSVPEIRNSSLRRLLDPPTRQRHSIAGNLRQSLFSTAQQALKDRETEKKARNLIDEAMEKFKKSDKEEKRRVSSTLSTQNESIANDMDGTLENFEKIQEPKHIQRHYSYTYDMGPDSSSILGKLSVSNVPRKKYLESNFDENEQVITTVIETDVPLIMANPKDYGRKVSGYSNETPKWIRKYLENESPKAPRKPTTGNKELPKTNRKNSRRKSSLESIDTDKGMEKVRSKSVSSDDRSSSISRSTATDSDFKNNFRNTYVRIVQATDSAQKNRYEIGVDTGWTESDIHGCYGDDGDYTDSGESTSV